MKTTGRLAEALRRFLLAALLVPPGLMAAEQADWPPKDPVEKMVIAEGAGAKVRLNPEFRTALRQFELAERSLVAFVAPDTGGTEKYETDFVIRVRNGGGEEIGAIEQNREHGTAAAATFVLRPGRYWVALEKPANQWPTPPLEPKWRDREFSLEVRQLARRPLPSTLRSLDDWLEKTGLAKYLEPTELADWRDPARDLPGATRRLSYAALFAAAARTPALHEKVYGSLQDVAPVDSDGIIGWPRDVPAEVRPVLVVALRARTNREHFAALEGEFEKHNGITVWDRILQKLSSSEAVPAGKIVIEVPIWCSAGIVFRDGTTPAYRHGMDCMSATAAVTVPVVLAAGVAPATLSHGVPDLGSAISSILPGLLPAGAQLDYLTRNSGYVEIIVRGLHGCVVPGNADWERLQIMIVQATGNPPQLYVTVDGRLASGLGGYPADPQFTRDMEPDHSGSLSEFAKRLAEGLRVRLAAN